MPVAAGQGSLVRKWRLFGAMLSAPDLRRSALAVAWYLLDCFNESNGYAWPSHGYLTEKIGIDRRSVRRAIDRLAKSGWFSVVRQGRGRGRSDRYVPTWEKGAPVRHLSDTENGATVSAKMAQPCPENGAPVRPYTLTKPLNKPRKKGTSRGTRFREGAKLPPKWAAYATGKGHTDPPGEWENFSDHFLAKPNPLGLKVDWFAAWRAWVRRSLKGWPNDGKRASTTRRATSPHGALFEAGAAVANRQGE